MNKEETFTEAYREYSSMVIKSVVAQTGDIELGNEICQNVFLSYYRSMDRVEKEYVKAWLLHATKNQLIDHWRKSRSRKELLMDHNSEEFPQKFSSNDTEKEGCNKMFACELLEDLKRTKPHWYDVVECVCVMEMRPEEACEYLGLSPGVLRGRLQRARHYIKEKYGEDW